MFIGLMSGTSIDAIDAVLVEFSDTDEVVLIAHHRHAWPSALRHTLLTLSQQVGHYPSHQQLASLDIQVGQLFAEAVLALLEKASLAAHQITAIGSPGQTIYHNPKHSPPYTWQLGDPSVIAQNTRIVTVADFRRRDVAAGGQGAPLTPAYHNVAFRHPLENRVVLNLGGIANITVLRADSSIPVIGFDTGPANALLNAWIERHQQKTMDVDGTWANTGKVNVPLLRALLGDSYFSYPPPKTTGRDYFNLYWLATYLKDFAFVPEDVQATLCQLTVDSVIQAVQNYQPQRLIVCGGGVYNRRVMTGLVDGLPNCIVESSVQYGIDPDLVEAISFAWLAKQRLELKNNHLPSVTGARETVVLGAVYV